MKIFLCFVPLLLAAQSVETVPVVSQGISRSIHLPGEILPWESVDVRARVPGFVARVLVDKGDVVKAGDLLVELDAPEMKSQLAEARAKVEALQSQRGELDAKRIAAESTLQRLKMASETQGAVAQNEVTLAEQAVAGAQASIKALEGSVAASLASVKTIEETMAYLKVTAPFDGVVTERRIHPGALAGPQTEPMLHLEDNSRLRLVIALPETDVAGIAKGAKTGFTVPAYPGQTFYGTVARNPHSMDAKTRTMAVELDVDNARGLLAPGMFPEVAWTASNPRKSLLVPSSAVATNTERTFVIRVTDGKAEWVDVRKGVVVPSPKGDLVEVLGGLKEGDVVVRRATDEIRNGSMLK